MTAIRLMFPGGRYHATPWGRHVNEGAPEWPPSPYRLLRAMYDVWRRKCFELTEGSVRSALEALAITEPEFRLPFASATHTRAYLNANAQDPTDKNLVFDPFVVFDRPQQCFLCWPELSLSAEQRATIDMLLRNLNYLGRSESWVQAELWDGPTEAPVWAAAAESAEEGDEELAAVACAIPVSAHTGQQGWLDALTYSTGDLLRQRASSPPLLRQVRYRLPKNAVAVDPKPKAAARASRVDAVLLGLDATVLPLITAALEVAEQVRVRLMGAHKRRLGNDESKVSPLFSGKTAEGEKRLDHGHVYILPQGNGMGRIDRILIVSRLRTFAEDELDAIRGVRELYQRDGRPAVRCVMTWQGQKDGATPQFRRGKVFESTTPFVPPRHWRKGRDWIRFLEEEVRRECRNHDLKGDLVRVEAMAQMPGLFDVIEYRRNRKEDPVRPGFALRLTFENDVSAPFAIGYGAHFGLGQFAAADD